MAHQQSVEAHDRATAPLARRRTPLQRISWSMHDGDHATLHDACAYVNTHEAA